MDGLVVVGCSKSSLKQRAGRAGRERPGKVYRLFTKLHENRLSNHQTPEIQRCNLVHSLIQLKSLGIDDLIHFDFLSPPPPHNIIDALDVLFFSPLLPSLLSFN